MSQIHLSIDLLLSELFDAIDRKIHFVHPNFYQKKFILFFIRFLAVKFNSRCILILVFASTNKAIYLFNTLIDL